MTLFEWWSEVKRGWHDGWKEYHRDRMIREAEKTVYDAYILSEIERYRKMEEEEDDQAL